MTQRIANAIGLAAMTAAWLLLCLVHPVRGQTPEHFHLHSIFPFYKSWMQPSNRSVSCCSEKDCSPAASTFKSGKWYAQRNGEWIEIPTTSIETERDSPDGQSHLCADKFMNGWHVYCFLPAAGG